MGVRAAGGYNASQVSTQQRAVPTTGQTVTVTQTNAPRINLVIDPAGTLVALTVAFPTGAFDGQVISFMTTQALTGLTLTTVTGTLVGALTTAALNAFATYVWNATTSVWYRIG